VTVWTLGRIVAQVDAPDTSLWKHRSFNMFWIGQTLSTTGDAFTAVAFPLLVYRTTGSVQGMTLVTACTFAGGLVSGVVSGRIVDSSDRRRLMMATDLVRAGLMGAVPLLAAMHCLAFPLLCLIALAVGFLGSLFGVAYTAFVPELVSKARVVDANARLQASAAVSFVVGPALAGLAAQAWGAETAVGLDGVSFLASLGSLAMVRGQKAPPEARQPGERWVGLRFIWATPALRVLIAIITLETFTTAAAIDMFTFHLRGTLGQSDSSVGIMFAVASLGGVAGATLLPVLKRRLGSHVLFIGTALALGVAFAVVPSATTLAFTSAVAITFTFCETTRSVLSVSRRQEVTPDALLGRVTAAAWLMIDAARMTGAATVGFFAQRYGSAAAFRGMGAALIVLALLTLPARSLRD
jgi:MFS family permease